MASVGQWLSGHLGNVFAAGDDTQITGSDWANNKNLPSEGQQSVPGFFNAYSTIKRNSAGFQYYNQSTTNNDTSVVIPRIQNLYNNSKYLNVVDTEFSYFIPPSTIKEIQESFTPPPDGIFITYPNGRVDDATRIVYFMENKKKRFITDWQTVQVMLRERNLQYSSIQIFEVMEIGLIEDGYAFETRANEWTPQHPVETGYSQLSPNDPGEQDIVEHLRAKWENKMMTIDWGNDQGIWEKVPSLMKTDIKSADDSWKYKYAEPMSPILKDNLTKTVVENKLSPGMRTRLHKDTFIMINGKYRRLPYNENSFVFSKEITTENGDGSSVVWVDVNIDTGDYFWWFYYVSRNYEDNTAEPRYDGNATPNGVPPSPWPTTNWSETNPLERFIKGNPYQHGGAEADRWVGGLLNPSGAPLPSYGAIAFGYIDPTWWDGYTSDGTTGGTGRTSKTPYQGAKIFNKDGVCKGWWDDTRGCGYYAPGDGTSEVTVTTEDNNVLLQTGATFKTFYDIYQLYSNYNGFTHLATPFDESGNDPERYWSHYKGGHPPSTYLIEGKGINPEGAPDTPNPSATSFDGYHMTDNTSGVMNQSLYWDPNISQILGTSIQLLPKKQLHPNTVLWTYGQAIYDQLFRNPIYSDDGRLSGYEDFEDLTLSEYQTYLDGGDPLAKPELQPYYPQGHGVYYPTTDSIQVEYDNNYDDWANSVQTMNFKYTYTQAQLQTKWNNSVVIYANKAALNQANSAQKGKGKHQTVLLPGKWPLPIANAGKNIPMPSMDSVKRERAWHDQARADAIRLAQTDTNIYNGPDWLSTHGGSAFFDDYEFDGPPLIVGNVGNSGPNIFNNLPDDLQYDTSQGIYKIHGVGASKRASEYGEQSYYDDSDNEIFDESDELPS